MIMKCLITLESMNNKMLSLYRMANPMPAGEVLPNKASYNIIRGTTPG
jgi:hypothetical protein